MIFIWKGRGWLVLIIALLAIFCSNQTADYFVTMFHYRYETLFQIACWLIYTGVFIKTCFVLLPKLEEKNYYDLKTKEIIIINPRDELYCLDVKLWAYGMIMMGIVLIIYTFIKICW